MNTKDLDVKRLEPCMAEVFAAAKGPDDNLCPQNFEMWRKYAVWAYYHDNKPNTIVPMDCFYIDKDKLGAIVKKWCRGLHGFWYYTPKLDFEDPNYKKKVKELHDFRDFESAVYKDKTLTYAQRAAKIKKEALAHNFMWRSRDKEYISNNIYLGASPNSSKEWTDRTNIIYKAIEEGFKRETFKLLYIAYDRMDIFAYTNRGSIRHAQVENVKYWHDKNGLVKEECTTPHCNLYDDDGNFVEELWNYIAIRREMSADTFNIMMEANTQALKNILSEWGYDEIVNRLDERDAWMDSDVKQCYALYMMTMWWRADNFLNKVLPEKDK